MSFDPTKLNGFDTPSPEGTREDCSIHESDQSKDKLEEHFSSNHKAEIVPNRPTPFT